MRSMFLALFLGELSSPTESRNETSFRSPITPSCLSATPARRCSYTTPATRDSLISRPSGASHSTNKVEAVRQKWCARTGRADLRHPALRLASSCIVEPSINRRGRKPPAPLATAVSRHTSNAVFDHSLHAFALPQPFMAIEQRELDEALGASHSGCRSQECVRKLR